MAYPCVIGVAATALAVGLVRGIMPQILPLLTGLHSDLPFLTKVVMRLSTWSMDWGVFAGMGSVLTAVIALWSYKRFEHVKLAVQHCLLHTPIIGALAERYALTTFFRSFGMLMESGMTADKAYIRAASAPTMIPIKRRLLSGIAALEKGEKIGHILDQKGVPRSISPLISSGESSGRLPSALSRAAVILDREIDHSLKRLTALIEPVMMLGMGCMVGSIALSIMMPIYDISKTLQH
jgi:type II secretory pathway component PulF